MRRARHRNTRTWTRALPRADCGIILFADAERQIIGAAHAGWKGALTGVLEATIDAMETKGARRDAISAALGPTIGPDSVRSRPGIFRALSRCLAGLCELLQALGARRPFHVRSAALHRRAGEKRRNLPVRDLAASTLMPTRRACFSYRRSVHRNEPDYGRLIAAIALV